MGRYAIIGLGTFGSSVANSLFQKGHEVIAIDISEDLVQRARDVASQCITADATDRETLEALGLTDVDYAVISVGDKIDASILITLHLTELGVKNIVVKAINDTHGKILKKIGATEVVYPEKQMAVRIADRIGHKHVLDQIQLGDGISILEVATPGSLVGKTIREANMRRDFSLNIIALKEVISQEEEHTYILPGPDDVLKAGYILIVIGPDDKIEEFKSRQSS
jgi:trk system potassium uptake protein